MSIILVDLRDTIKRCAASFEVVLSELRASIVCFVQYVVMILQALAAVPMIMLSSLIRRKNFDKLGLQIYPYPGKRLISWSDLLHGDLIEEICTKVGTTSPGNVIMMACSYALRDYYQQVNILTSTHITPFTTKIFLNNLSSFNFHRTTFHILTN